MQRIEAADYHDVVQVADPRVAPDGERVAFVRKTPVDDEEYEATVYLASTGGSAARRFTVAEGRDSEPRWSPSGDRLAFVSNRGADDDRPQLWVVPTDGGEGRQVTDVAGGVSAVEWSPDGERIAFVQQVSAEDREAGRDLAVPVDYEPEPPDPRVVDRTVYRSMERFFDGRRGQVYVVDLDDRVEAADRPGDAGGAIDDAGDDVDVAADGVDAGDADAAGTGDDAGDAPGDAGGDGGPSPPEPITRVTDEDYDHGSPTWRDPDTLYYTASRGEPDPDDSSEYDVVEHDLAADVAETVHTTTAWAAGLAATGDGRVAFHHVEDDRASLRPTKPRVLDADAGEVTTPAADLDRTLGGGIAPQWGPDEELLYFATPDEGATALWAAPWDGTGDAAERVLRDDGASIHGAHVGADLVAFVRSEWDHPGDVFVATRGGGEEHRLTRVNAPLLDDRAVREPEPLAVEGDGGDLQGWVLAPPDFDPEATYPLVVEVHGGPHAMWTTSGTMWHEFQTLAARGYVVFWSNPRGSSGYGADFMAAIERDWGDVTMADVMAGVEAVAAREYVDEGNVFLTGGSFGGYMASWMVGSTDYFRAAVTQRGVHDLVGFYGSTDRAYKLVEGDFDATPWEEPSFLWEQSPTARAHEVDTPTLVMHSEDDTRTPINTAELFHRILRKYGVDTRLVRYPEEGHELSRSGQPAHVVDRLERIARWFDGYSDHHDAPPALERDPDAGLTVSGDDADGDEGDEAQDAGAVAGGDDADEDDAGDPVGGG